MTFMLEKPISPISFWNEILTLDEVNARYPDKLLWAPVFNDGTINHQELLTTFIRKENSLPLTLVRIKNSEEDEGETYIPVFLDAMYAITFSRKNYNGNYDYSNARVTLATVPEDVLKRHKIAFLDYPKKIKDIKGVSFETEIIPVDPRITVAPAFKKSSY